jgi:hypothetical protein
MFARVSNPSFPSIIYAEIWKPEKLVIKFVWLQPYTQGSRIVVLPSP